MTIAKATTPTETTRDVWVDVMSSSLGSVSQRVLAEAKTSYHHIGMAFCYAGRYSDVRLAASGVPRDIDERLFSIPHLQLMMAAAGRRRCGMRYCRGLEFRSCRLMRQGAESLEKCCRCEIVEARFLKFLSYLTGKVFS